MTAPISGIWPPGYGRAHHDALDSTNAEARRLAQAGEAGPLWVTAAKQTAGRGRRGRVWDSGSGNLAATLLLRPAKQPFGQLSFAAALATAEMVTHFAPNAAIRVKWPNDVLADGRKLAGILLESELDSNGGGWLAIGIGVNLADFPATTEFPATSLAALGVPPPAPDEALTVLAASMARWYDAWMAEGFEVLRSAWLARAKGLGQAIRARLPQGEHLGLFEGIDGEGALLLNQQGSVRSIAAGEVFF